MKKLFLALIACLSVSVKGDPLAESARELLKKAKPETCAVRADTGIFYHTAELEHLTKEPLDSARIRTISRSRRPAAADPVPAILHFHQELARAGIRLILIPVPPKAVVEPLPGTGAGEAMVHLRKFYNTLRKQGVTVLDMTEPFLAMKKAGVSPFCRTDSHWSPQGVQTAAEKCAALLNLSGTENFSFTEAKRAVRGDLLSQWDPSGKETEVLTLRIVKAAFSEDSPVLVLGDSHIMVFSTGGSMLASNAGFCEQLMLSLRMPVERIGTLGSASTSVRIQLYQKARKNPAWLKKKKAVIWCFAARELTESENGWVKVPLR